MKLEATLESNRQQAASNFARYELRPIEQAQIAWDAGLQYVNVKLIGLRVFAQAAGTADSDDREIHWTSTIARIVEIGWRLHTWCVVQKGDRLVALPLFERASGPTG